MQVLLRAMAKAFGFGEKAAYDMSTALTGLAGDVASFYNISQDEAYTKLKSVFTGETESLKDLGIVMTQAALDSYALSMVSVRLLQTCRRWRRLPCGISSCRISWQRQQETFQNFGRLGKPGAHSAAAV